MECKRGGRNINYTWGKRICRCEDCHEDYKEWWREYTRARRGGLKGKRKTGPQIPVDFERMSLRIRRSGMTQARISEEAGLARNYVTQYLSQKWRTMNLGTLDALCAVLDIDMWEVESRSES